MANQVVRGLMDKIVSDEAKPDVLPYESAGDGVREELLKNEITEVLRTIYDPEIPVDIYELGLIYDVKVNEAGGVHLLMTLTSPACPVAGTLPIEVENKVAAVPGVTDVKLDLVWEPPYSMDMMSEAARLQLGLL